MKPSKAMLAFVEQHVSGLCVCMNLTHFNVNIFLCDLGDATMDIETDFRYLEARLRIDTGRLTEMWKEDKDLILACLAHKLSHLVTSEMSGPFAWKGKRCGVGTRQQIHFEERVTETVSRWALRLYKLENKL